MDRNVLEGHCAWLAWDNEDHSEEPLCETIRIKEIMQVG
jgi:hypothetical protein